MITTANAYEEVTAKNIAGTLDKYYPGHLWAVHVDGQQGVASIQNMMLQGKWGFRIFLGEEISATDLDKIVMRAGGEILERYRQSRGRADQDALGAVPTNFRGHAIPDL